MDKQRAQTLAELFTQTTQQYSNHRAFTYRPTFRTLSWTYENIWDHASSFVDILEKRNINKGDRVLLIGFNSPYWVAAFFAIHLKGSIAVPLSPESTPEFIQKIIDQTEAKLIFKNQFLDTEKLSIPVIVIEDIPIASRKNTTSPLLNIDEDDIAEIVYTSGTTGDPKGVVLSHKNLLSSVQAAHKRIPVDHTMRFASILPLFHMFEQVGGLLVPLSVGAQISYVASLNPNHLKWVFQDDQINRMLVVPEFLRLMYLRIREQAKEQGELARLQALLRVAQTIPSMSIRRILFAKLHRQIGWRMHTVVSGGAALDKEVGEFWEHIGIHVLQGYGLTETSPVLTANGYSDRRVDSVGKPIDGVSIKIAKDEEVLAKGANIFQGYWSPSAQATGDKLHDAKTKEVFDEEGWFHTGDMGFFDKRGHLHIKGRKKFMIVLSSGENVYAEDVESELNKETGVVDSTVIGLKRDGGTVGESVGADEQVHAVLLLNKKHKLEPQQIVNRANQRLLSYQRIQSFSVWPFDDFPRTPTRKVKKHEVIPQVISQLEGRTQQRVPLPSLSRLEHIIAQVLEIPPQDIQDEKRLVADFNLDSLQRIELVAKIENELSISLDESEITQQTTVRELKTMIEGKHQKQIRYPFNPKPFTLFRIFLRGFMQPIFFKVAMFLYAPAQVQGVEHLKNIQHPVLFFSNHLSTADGAVIYGALPARIRLRLAAASASDVVYENDMPWIKYSRGFLELLFPIFPFVRQEGQVKSSFVYVGRIIDRGFSVLLFPEGRTSETGQFQSLKQGAGLLGIEMGVPIIPIKLADTQKVIPTGPEHPVFQWPKRHKVTVTFGKQFTVDPGLSYREATSFIEKQMRAV